MDRESKAPARREIRGRLAPSPTGHLHLGHARSFLLAYWHARHRGGRLTLRLEDVDVDRASSQYEEEAIEDLRWLGLDWDGEPVVQTAHEALTRGAAEELVARGLAYPCTCSRRQLREAASAEPRGAPHQGAVELRYPGTCRGKYSSIEQAERQSKRAAGLRLVTADETIEFSDLVYGNQSFNVFRQVGDFLILRRDKSPAYQLAVTVSDIADGVTEVLRGADLLSSTARQILIYRALGRTPPQFAHLPLVCDASGERLSKRAFAVSLRTLRERGLDPRRIVRWAALTSGQVAKAGTPELFSAKELVEAFDLARLDLSPVLVSDEDWLS